MNKVLVEVYVPSLGTAYDMFIPLQLPMFEVLELIKKSVTELSNGRFKADENTAICNKTDGTILNINLSVLELGIKNGSRLMLI